MSLTDKEFDEAVDLFAMPGWKTLMEEIEDQLDLCTIDACNNAGGSAFQQGQGGSATDVAQLRELRPKH